jgi:two-component system OmpR family sensor kinase
VIEVRDHGPGISDEDTSKVFERFYRADTSRTRETGGSGLGLAIVAAIVGSHGGSVRVEATDGGGATLVVSLPVRNEDAGSLDAEGRNTQAEGSDGRTSGAQNRGDGGDHNDGRVIHI